MPESFLVVQITALEGIKYFLTCEKIGYFPNLKLVILLIIPKKSRLLKLIIQIHLITTTKKHKSMINNQLSK